MFFLYDDFVRFKNIAGSGAILVGAIAGFMPFRRGGGKICGVPKKQAAKFMPKRRLSGLKKSDISMTSRILSVYHLFINCNEVSVKEVTNQLSETSVKTIYRNIKLLKDAGVLQVRYSRKAGAFIPLSIEPTEPVLPESRTKRLITEKIRRLCILMRELYEFEDEEKPLHIELYKELFPNTAVRTRQRDFAELARLGYIGRRTVDIFCDDDKEKSCYSFEIPDTYGLNTFNEKDW